MKRELKTEGRSSMFYPAGPYMLRAACVAMCAASMFYLAGCASAPQVEYRVAPIPEPPVIARPELSSLNITSAMDPGSIIQAFREDIKKLQAAILEYERALDAYRKKDTK